MRQKSPHNDPAERIVAQALEAAGIDYRYEGWRAAA
jgi:hypothetical protein